MCPYCIVRGRKDSLMPIEFDALPARVPVPDARTTTVSWLIALVIIVAAGAALSIATWPAARPTQTLWFWTRTFGLPFLAWLGLYSGWRFVLANRRRDALADNAAIELKEKFTAKFGACWTAVVAAG